MPIDPIVEEIHAIREALSKASGDDIRKIAEAARERQARSGAKSVELPPRRARITAVGCSQGDIGAASQRSSADEARRPKRETFGWTLTPA